MSQDNLHNHLLHYSQSQVDSYAHLPRINHPDGTRKLVENPDLWFACKINATLKTSSASEIYWQKMELPKENQDKFITGLRNHSINRQHMGAFIVGGIDFEVISSSLVSNAFTQGKFYRMQQQTRRSVILDSIISNPVIDQLDEVKSSYEERFSIYWDIVDKRPSKTLGFDPYIQDAFKILPLSTKTKFSGNMDLRTAKAYTRWRELSYLPDAVTEFANLLYQSVLEEYPIMFQSHFLNDSQDADAIQLEMINKVGSQDLLHEPMLWYADHTYLLPENKYFETIYNNLNLKDQFKESGSNSIFMGYFNPLGISLDDLLELFNNKTEASKSMAELACFAFISRIDISGGIDTWRHTRNNRIIQPIYHALDNNPTVATPVLLQRQEKKAESDLPQIYREQSLNSIKLYHSLVKQGIPKKEAVNVVPHTLELYQIEMMDLFSFLNVMALRTCIHSRPDVQLWSKSLLREVSKTQDFKGLDQLLQDGILARGIQFGYCAELGNCRKCGKDVVYLPDPMRS